MLLTTVWVAAVTALVVYGMFLLGPESPWAALAALESIALLCLPAVWWNLRRIRAPIRLVLFLVLSPLLLGVFGLSVYYFSEKLGFSQFPGLLLALIPPALVGAGIFWLIRLAPDTPAESAPQSGSNPLPLWVPQENPERDAILASYAADPAARVTCVHLVPIESALREAGVHVWPDTQSTPKVFSLSGLQEKLTRTLYASAMLDLSKLKVAISLPASVQLFVTVDDNDYYEDQRLPRPHPALSCAACESSIKFWERSEVRFPA